MNRTVIVVADAARARIYTFDRSVEPDGPHEDLREERDLVDSERRERPSELSSDAFMFDDHRQQHLNELDTRFAKDIVAAVETIVRDRGYRKLIVVTSSRMIGDFRKHFEPLLHAGVTIEEVPHDYTKLTTTALRDRLAELGMVPARQRLVFANR